LNATDLIIAWRLAMTRNLSWDSDESEALVDGHGYASIADWISSNSSWETLLYTHGFILFRGFGITDPTAFDVTLDSLMQPSLEFSEETSPRSGVTDRIFTSTDYPKDYPIQFHHEFSYRKSYPDRLAFCCLRPAENGGATPLADSRKVLHRIPDDIVTRFEKLGITYIRNFTGLGLSWEDAFGTSDKEQVSDYCRSNGVHYSWSGDDLHTRQTAPAVITHPVTGERAWFNSAINLNVSGIEPKPVRDALRLLPENSIPTNTLYGSGKQIEPDVIETLRLAYTEEAIRFDWQSGDVLLIDNLLTAHSREPFRGERKIIVGMGSLASHCD
jgi:alpha-ketoglutarate-dependent taurine dioxygenase